MSQPPVPPSSLNYGQDEIPHLRSQNDQLWKIIEKQRVMIQNLQKDNVRLSAERDGLQDQVHFLEKEITRKQRVTSLLISPQTLREIAEQEDAVSTPSSETTPSPIEVYATPTTTTTNAPMVAAAAAAAASVGVSPMPPPRSPYRPLKEKPDDVGLMMESPKRWMDQEPESYLATAAAAAATTTTRMEDYTSLNGRSSPGSPAPGPHSPTLPKYQQQQRKDSAPLPSTTSRNHSPFIVPSPSKSSSSLEVRKNARQRDSMMPPARAALEHDPTMRAASPPLMPSSSSFRSTTTNTNSTTTITTTNTNMNNANIHTNNTTTTNTTISTNPVINSNYIPPHSNSPIYGGRGKQDMYSSSRTDLASYGDDDDPTATAASPSVTSSSNTTTKQHNAFMGNMANVCIKVVGSNIKPNDKGKEVVSFILSVGSYKDDVSHEFDERWRVEKLYSDFLTLDSKLKAQRNRAISGRIGKLPDKALFSNNAPTKVDQRKVALEQYLQHIVSLPLEDASDLCEFLSTNVMDTKVYQLSGQKEGYLTKRGKNFGGWKTRYFVLNESVLEYYESKEGTQLGSIRLTNAQIGTQMNGSSASSSSAAQEESNSVYRHAFLIVEQKRVNSTHSVRHILCANSDDDRDTWVHALLQNISIVEDDALLQKKRKNEKPRKLSKGEIRAISATPISHLKLDHVGNADMEKLTSVPSHHDDASIGMAISNNGYSRPTPSISSESTADSATMISSSLPSNNNNNNNTTSTWSSYEAGRTSLDQRNNNNNNNNNTLHAPRPPIVRRSSMGNLISNNEQQQQNEDQLNFHNYRRAVSPTIISRVPDEAPPVAAESEKKARNKAHRMTFWGKKMLFNSSEDQDSQDHQQLSQQQQQQSQQQQQQQREGQPRPSQSSSATTSSSNSAGLRGFLSRSSHEQNDRQRNKYDDVPVPKQAAKQVFGVSLEEAVRISRVADGYELPAVVYRCIEYLDAMDAVLEEGLYRLSGSNATMKALRERFNQEGDVNLMAAKEEYDVHVVAGLLKMWLRELPTSVLTREHRMDFLHVIDLLDRKDRVNELGRLVSVLPLSNYTLLRALTAHLIRVVQHSDINKMTMRNVSIVFSPTLGIPATIFNLFMSEFEYIFWTTKDGDAAPRRIEDEVVVIEEPVVVVAPPAEQTNKLQMDSPSRESLAVEQPEDVVAVDPPHYEGLSRKTTLRLREEHGRSNRNSVNYMDGAPNAIVDLEKHMDGPPVLDEDEDEDVDDLTLSNESNYSVHSN